MEEFGGELSGPPIEQLAALRQTGTVDEFANTFRARVAQIPGLAPHIQLGLFLNGLKPEIRVRLRPNDVNDLRTSIRVARAVEREIEFLSSSRIPGRSGRDEDSAYKRRNLPSGYGGTIGPYKHDPAQSFSVVQQQPKTFSHHVRKNLHHIIFSSHKKFWLCYLKLRLYIISETCSPIQQQRISGHESEGVLLPLSTAV